MKHLNFAVVQLLLAVGCGMIGLHFDSATLATGVYLCCHAMMGKEWYGL